MRRIELVGIGLILLIVVGIAGCTSISKSGPYNVTSNETGPGISIIKLPDNTKSVTVDYNVSLVNSTGAGRVAFYTSKSVPQNNREALFSFMRDDTIDSDFQLIGRNSPFMSSNVTLNSTGAKSLVIQTDNANGTFTVTTT